MLGTLNRFSRREPLADPLAAFEPVAQAVVQAAFAALPELPAVWLQAVAAPVRRAGRVQHEARGVFGGFGHEPGAARDGLALRAGLNLSRLFS